MVRALYLDYPDLGAAYDHPGEYLYGPDVLVAPVTTPGQVTTQEVWFPPGRWVDYFTGATFDGPTTATIKVPLDRIPVFVKAGGIVAEQPQMSHVGAQPASPLTLKAYSGARGSFTLYSDAGEGLGYRSGEYAETPISYQESSRQGSASSLTIGADRGHYPGQLRSRAYDVDLVDLTEPHEVTVDRAQSAAVSLTLDPPTPTSLAAGQTTTVTATLTDAGPGAISGASVSLSGPEDWTIAPTTPIPLGTIAEGESKTASWSVTAPADAGGTASLRATATYTSDANGSPRTVIVAQGPPASLPPVITSVEPTSASAGQLVTINGHNFGDTQGASYLFFVDGDTSWGAPFDAAEFHVNSWSDTKITFTVPTPSGPGGIWHVTPGTTATVSVNTSAGSSAPASIKITG